MPRTTAEERALARAALYRLLAVAFSYPTEESIGALAPALRVAEVAGGVLGGETAAAATRFAAAAGGASRSELEAAYQRIFTLSYSEDCPMYETAFSARHLFQQTQQLADLAGFYRAFGVTSRADRADHIALELEFCYLLAVKEAAARSAADDGRRSLVREAQRAFVGQHLARWAPLFAGRAAAAGAGTPYAAAAHLLDAFVSAELRFLRLGEVGRYRNEPAPVESPGEMGCPLAESAVASLVEQLPPKEGADARVAVG